MSTHNIIFRGEKKNIYMIPTLDLWDSRAQLFKLTMSLVNLWLVNVLLKL